MDQLHLCWNFKNNIYLIPLRELIHSIVSKKDIFYDILRSNKGLNYITIIGQTINEVVLFLSKPFYENEILYSVSKEFLKTLYRFFSLAVKKSESLL